jgi:hypothetical protein
MLYEGDRHVELLRRNISALVALESEIFSVFNIGSLLGFSAFLSPGYVLFLPSNLLFAALLRMP